MSESAKLTKSGKPDKRCKTSAANAEKGRAARQAKRQQPSKDTIEEGNIKEIDEESLDEEEGTEDLELFEEELNERMYSICEEFYNKKKSEKAAEKAKTQVERQPQLQPDIIEKKHLKKETKQLKKKVVLPPAQVGKPIDPFAQFR